MIKILVSFVVIVFFVPSAWGASLPTNLRDGDIIFHASRSSQSIAVQRATGSRYSHMGIIFFRDGQPYVFEAIGTVQYTPLGQWIGRGDGGHYVIKRLQDAERIMTPEAVARLKRAATKFKGKPYDLTFEWSDARIYCSELVWKIYDRGLGLQIGRLQKLGDFQISDAVVRAKMKERYAMAVPLDETVISPGEMFASDKLVVVAER